MATLATDAFTGTNGAAPSQWARATTGGGNFTVQSNRGRMAVTGTGYTNVRYYWSTLGKVADSSVYCEITLSAITEQTIWVAVRDTGDNQFWPSGLYIRIQPSAGNYESGAAYGTEGYQKVTTPLTMTAGMTLGVELYAVGSAIKTRVWNLAGTKPAAWDREWTNTDNLAAGYATLGSWSGQSTNPTYDVDNAQATDGASGTVTGSVALSGSGTVTGTGTPKVTATRAYTGAGSFTTAAQPKPTSATALSGTGSLTLTGSSTALGTAARTGTGTLDTTGQPTTTGTADMASAGTLTIEGHATTGSTLELSSAGTITLSGTPATSGHATFTATGTATADGTPRIIGDTASLGAGTLTLSGTPSTAGSLDLTGSGALTYSTTGSASGHAELAGAGQLTITGTARINSALTLGSTGNTATTAKPTTYASTNLAGIGALTLRHQQQDTRTNVTVSLADRTTTATVTNRQHAANITRPWKATLNANHPA